MRPRHVEVHSSRCVKTKMRSSVGSEESWLAGGVRVVVVLLRGRRVEMARINTVSVFDLGVHRMGAAQYPTHCSLEWSWFQSL